MTHHNFTSIDDLFNENEDDNALYEPVVTVTPLSTLYASTKSKSVMQPCEIRCTDILNHITMCPVCSKLYKEVEKNHKHHHHPVDRREHFVTAQSDVNNCSMWKTAVIVLGALLLIILLLWLKSKFIRDGGNAKIAPAFSPYMNRR